MAIDQSNLAWLMTSPARHLSNVGALSALVWDILITMDDEINFIWLTKWTFFKLFYFFTRYFALSVVILLNSVSLNPEHWLIFQGVSAIVLELCTEIILILRIRAIYCGNRRLIFGLFGAMAVQATVMVVSISTSIPKISNSPRYNSVIPKELIVFSVASLAYQLLLFGLVWYKFVMKTRNGHQWDTDALLTGLIRDSMLAFGVIFVVLVANTLMFLLTPGTLGALGCPWVLAILGSVGSRLVLNVRVDHARITSNRTISHINTSDNSSSYRSSVLADRMPYSSLHSTYRLTGSTTAKDDDDMYIPYNGPRMFTKPSTNYSPVFPDCDNTGHSETTLSPSSTAAGSYHASKSGELVSETDVFEGTSLILQSPELGYGPLSGHDEDGGMAFEEVDPGLLESQWLADEWMRRAGPGGAD
ncbi:hypothetical protein BXZ70DRAFT_648973 [Cristinia sonorae]|uniref:DUF6533 domain-containing protein n=1 Tax=Cristinia sonorae TaxID=1940300 RepID=A0A8K0UE24_9AGAR|nr:hypothetical protein BXZ70DRAFT_648973 [Cristinia sonorae]